MVDLSALGDEDLKKRWQTMVDELEELEEERSFVLKQTGLHLPGHTVKKYEAEIQALKDNISKVSSELSLRKNHLI